MPGRKLDLKLYIEGVEVPCPGATIQIATNQASTCSLTMVPIQTLTRIRPKSHVHLFWFEDVSEKWVLLWEGEVLGYSFSKSPTGRNIQLECSDLSNYWDYSLKSTVNGYLNQTRSVDETMFFGDKQALVDFSSDGKVVGNKVWQLLMKYQKKGGMPRALYETMQFITAPLKYYEHLTKRLKLHDQINLAPDLENESFLNIAEQCQMLITQMDGRGSQMASLREIFSGFFSLMQYDCISLGAPAMVSGWGSVDFETTSGMIKNIVSTAVNNPSKLSFAIKAATLNSGLKAYASKTRTLKSIILKPNLFGCIPPKCNVILPDICTSISFSRSFMNEPTRSWMRTSEIYNNVNDIANKVMTYFAPEAMFAKYQNFAKLNGAKVFFDTFSDEELEKGILPQQTTLPFAETAVIRSRNQALFNKAEGKGVAKSAADKLVATVDPILMKQAEYQFQLSRYASRIMNVTMEFNPWLVCGFPCFVADSSISFFGNIESITHTIDANSGGSTIIQCSLVRECDPVNDTTPTIPEWTSDLFQPKNISDTYEKLIGCRAMCDGKPTETGIELLASALSGKKPINMSMLASTLYYPKNRAKSEYHRAVDANGAYAFADSYRRRTLATIEDIQNFYEMRPEGKGSPPKMFSGKMFDYYTDATNTGASIIAYPPGPNGERLISGPNHKQKIIIDYVNELSESQVLDGR